MFGRNKRHRFENVDVEVHEREKEPCPASHYDPYPEWCAEIERENERREREAKEQYEEYMAEYRAAKRDLPDWQPDVEVKDYAAGPFLCFDGQELPISHIEGIEVAETGSEPTWQPLIDLVFRRRGCWIYARHDKGIENYPSDDERSMPCQHRYTARANKASIRILMSSGRKHTVECWPFQVEILKERLEQAWKEAK